MPGPILVTIWLLLSLPSLPILALITWLNGPTHGTSGLMGLCMLIGPIIGIFLWIVIAYLCLGAGAPFHILLPHVVWS